jgi:hypothetical protein
MQRRRAGGCPVVLARTQADKKPIEGTVIYPLPAASPVSVADWQQ